MLLVLHLLSSYSSACLQLNWYGIYNRFFINIHVFIHTSAALKSEKGFKEKVRKDVEESRDDYAVFGFHSYNKNNNTKQLWFDYRSKNLWNTWIVSQSNKWLYNISAESFSSFRYGYLHYTHWVHGSCKPFALSTIICFIQIIACLTEYIQVVFLWLIVAKKHTQLARTKMQMRELNYVKSVGPKTIDVASIIFYVWLTSLLLLWFFRRFLSYSFSSFLFFPELLSYDYSHILNIHECVGCL